MVTALEELKVVCADLGLPEPAVVFGAMPDLQTYVQIIAGPHAELRPVPPPFDGHARQAVIQDIASYMVEAIPAIEAYLESEADKS